jgi:hypothetical protein
MENLFDALCSALSETSIKKLFLDAEGPDLMVLMMKYVSTSLPQYRDIDLENTEKRCSLVRGPLKPSTTQCLGPMVLRFVCPLLKL